MREVAGDDAREPGADGASLATIGGMDDHVGACSARACRGPVARSVVDDDDRCDKRPDAVDHSSDGALFVECRNDSRDAHHQVRTRVSSAGRTTTDAVARASTLTTETTPIERSGG